MTYLRRIITRVRAWYAGPPDWAGATADWSPAAALDLPADPALVSDHEIDMAYTAELHALERDLLDEFDHWFRGLLGKDRYRWLNDWFALENTGAWPVVA